MDAKSIGWPNHAAANPAIALWLQSTPLVGRVIIARAMFSSDVQGAAHVSHHIATLNEDALRMLRRPWLFLLPRRFPTPFN